MVSPNSITIKIVVGLPVNRVWQLWTEPEHIVNWYTATPDWHTTNAENQLAEGGKFSWRMEAKDGSIGFDFTGRYDKVRPNEYIAFTLDDGRKVDITFSEDGDETTKTQTFEPEQVHSRDMQRAGWQSILDNFKWYAESK